MVERFPLHFLEAAYPGLHDLELDLAVRKAAGIGDSYPSVMVPSACVAEGGAVYDKTPSACVAEGGAVYDKTGGS